MLWQVDPAQTQPLFEQVASSVRNAIATGELQRGDRLPAAKDIATSLDINLHTVLRAYQELRHEGLIDVRRGRGAVVTADHAGRARVATLVTELVSEARRWGMSSAEVTRLIEKEF